MVRVKVKCITPTQVPSPNRPKPNPNPNPIIPTQVQRVVFKGLDNAEDGADLRNIEEEKLRFQAMMEARAAGCQIPSIDGMIVGLRKERRISEFELGHQLVSQVIKSGKTRKPNLLLTVRLIHAEESTLTRHHSECHRTAKQRAEEFATHRGESAHHRLQHLQQYPVHEMALVLVAAKKSCGIRVEEIEEVVCEMGTAQEHAHEELRRLMLSSSYTTGKCNCSQGLVPRFEEKLGYPLLGTPRCRLQIGSRGETMMIFLRLKSSFDAYRVSNMIEEFSVTLFPISVHYSSEHVGDDSLQDARAAQIKMDEMEAASLLIDHAEFGDGESFEEEIQRGY